MRNKDIDFTKTVRYKARELGFLECRIIRVQSLESERYHMEKWLGKGMQGTMDYMSRNLEKRLNPELLVNGARTLVMVLQNYFPSTIQTDPEAPLVAKYAFGKDYHFVMKEKLTKLMRFIQDEAVPCNGRIFVDSAPVLERAWARRAGLGWIGKNSNLISVEHGSFFFIGELIIDAELPYDEKDEVRDHCGTCTRCIDSCPTGAIVAPKVVDARKCISYQTIEHKGDLDITLKDRFMNRVFGCDICQDVCPWNLKSKPHQESGFIPDPELLELQSDEWHDMDRARFDKLFGHSAVRRAGFEGLKRNLAFIHPEKSGYGNKD